MATRKPRNIVHHLPQELQDDIFLRLPVKDLVRSRAVCKAWKSLIDSRNFKFKQLKSANNSPSSYLLWRSVNNSRHGDFLHFLSPDSFEISPSLDLDQFKDPSFIDTNPPVNYLFCSYLPIFREFSVANGLIMLSWNKYHVVWNPLSNEFWKIENPPGIKVCEDFPGLRGYGCSFGFDPKTQDYKILVAYFTYGLGCEEKGKIMYQVYSMKDKSWKFGSFDFAYVFLVSIADGFLDGKSYWLADKCGTEDGYVGPGVVVFDYSDETFELIKLSDELLSLMGLVDNRVGKQCVAVTTRGCVELILSLGEGDEERYSEVWGLVADGSWIWKLRVVLPSGVDVPRGLTKDGQLFFESSPSRNYSSEILLIDPGSGSYKNLEHRSAEFSVFTYVESLFSVDL